MAKIAREYSALTFGVVCAHKHKFLQVISKFFVVCKQWYAPQRFISEGRKRGVCLTVAVSVMADINSH